MKPMYFRNWALTQKIIVPTLLVVAFLLTVALLIGRKHFHQHLKAHSQAQANDKFLTYGQCLQQELNQCLLATSRIAHLPAVDSAFLLYAQSSNLAQSKKLLRKNSAALQTLLSGSLAQGRQVEFWLPSGEQLYPQNVNSVQHPSFASRKVLKGNPNPLASIEHDTAGLYIQALWPILDSQNKFAGHIKVYLPFTGVISQLKTHANEQIGVYMLYSMDSKEATLQRVESAKESLSFRLVEQTSPQFNKVLLTGALINECIRSEGVKKQLGNYTLWLSPIKDASGIVCGIIFYQLDQSELLDLLEWLDISAWLFGLFTLGIIGGLLYYLVQSQITIPLEKIHTKLALFSRGELEQIEIDPASVATSHTIGQIESVIHTLMHRIKTATAFASRIGEDNLDSSLIALNTEDRLTIALLHLRSNLVQVRKEEKIRAWSREGYAQFSDMLRKHEKVNTLAEDTLTNLVKYLGANQGAFFLQTALGPDSYERIASYAYGRKKFVSQSIVPGEGVIGACIQQQDTIYLTDIPDKYITIRSGLGEATPTCILMVPLMRDKQVLGVIEMASFQVMEAYQIEFVEKTAASIAAAVASLQSREHTLHLLSISRQQTQMLQAQEEEMRQTIEELAATQEEMGRSKAEIELLLEASQQKETILEEQEKMMRGNMEELALMQGEMYKKDAKQVKEIETLKASFQAKEQEMKQLILEMQVNESDMQNTEDRYRNLLIEFQTLQQNFQAKEAYIKGLEEQNLELKKSKPV